MKDTRDGGRGAADPARETAGDTADNLSLELDELDVDSIMKDIESRADKRRREGAFRDLPVLELEEERTGGGEAEVSLDPLHELIFLTQMARQYAEVTSHYPIGARRSPLGPFILFFKKVIRRFMTPYMDALFAKQREFNAQTLRSMETFLEMIKRERERSYHGGLDRYTAWVEMGFTEDDGDALREAARFFDPDRRILNLYCGKGDFLAAAGEEGRDAVGVEEDPRLIRMGQEENLLIIQARPLDYLESQPLESLQAVFVRDLGEREDSRELLWAVTALADRMERDGVLVALNHNPRSVLGVEEAFTDPTLLRLVHPETLEGLLLHVGFREVKVSEAGEFSRGEMEEWGKKAGRVPDIESGELAGLLFTPRRYLLEARR
ncbi:MAG: hypothetical protein SWK76_04800 [Actinomycetota bacterium]|nr:hypothetical protein [Actinomycetota bacterium]